MRPDRARRSAAATRLQSQNSGNPNSIAQAAAVEALTGPQDEIATMAAEFRARRDLVVERVRRIPGFSLPNVPEGAFYAFVERVGDAQARSTKEA